jgi:hypothetical protein
MHFRRNITAISDRQTPSQVADIRARPVHRLEAIDHNTNLIIHVLDLLELFTSTPTLLLRPDQHAVLTCFSLPLPTPVMTN